MFNFLKNLSYLWKTDALVKIESIKHGLQELHELAVIQKELSDSTYSAVSEAASNQEATNNYRWLIGTLGVRLNNTNRPANFQ